MKRTAVLALLASGAVVAFTPAGAATASATGSALAAAGSSVLAKVAPTPVQVVRSSAGDTATVRTSIVIDDLPAAAIELNKSTKLSGRVALGKTSVDGIGAVPVMLGEFDYKVFDWRWTKLVNANKKTGAFSITVKPAIGNRGYLIHVPMVSDGNVESHTATIPPLDVAYPIALKSAKSTDPNSLRFDLKTPECNDAAADEGFYLERSTDGVTWSRDKMLLTCNEKNSGAQFTVPAPAAGAYQFRAGRLGYKAASTLTGGVGEGVSKPVKVTVK